MGFGVFFGRQRAFKRLENGRLVGGGRNKRRVEEIVCSGGSQGMACAHVVHAQSPVTVTGVCSCSITERNYVYQTYGSQV